jgi:uncharacterized protein YecT (DUF1311 family)
MIRRGNSGMARVWKAYGTHVAVWALLAGPAAAQDIGFSPAATEACLAAAGDAPGREVCVGRSAEACAETPDGQTTVGMGFCYGAERDWWDARLNAAYGGLIRLEEAGDAELESLGSAAPRSAPALRAMQRAWIGFRDAACAWEVSQWGGGTGGGPAGAACGMEETGRQALALAAELAERQAQ